MPQTIPANAVVAVTAVATYQTATVMHVSHYFNQLGDISAGNGELELNNLITKHLAACWLTGADPDVCLNRFVTAFFLQYVQAQMVSPTRKYYVRQIMGTPGTVDEAGCPSDTNLTVSLRTDRVIRGTQGNKKFTGWPASAIEGNQWSATALTNARALGVKFGQILADSAATMRWVPIAWSKQRPTDRAQIITVTERQEVRVLRTRERGVGV